MARGGEDNGEDDNDEDDNDNEPPTADDLGLNDTVKDELAALPERARRQRLWEPSTLSNYDLHVYNIRTQNHVTMQKISEQFSVKSAPPAAKKVRKQAVAPPAGPCRQSTRLKAHTNAATAEDEQDPQETSEDPAGRLVDCTGASEDLSCDGAGALRDGEGALRDGEGTLRW